MIFLGLSNPISEHLNAQEISTFMQAKQGAVNEKKFGQPGTPIEFTNSARDFGDSSDLQKAQQAQCSYHT